MSWIESHDAIEGHPKLILLCSITGWSKNESIGLLHRLWWWATKYAEDGDLSKYPPELVASALDADLKDKKEFFSILQKSKWMDENFQLHDWWDYIKRYMKAKYHSSNPAKLLEIEKKANKKVGKPKGKPIGIVNMDTSLPIVTLHTDIPNIPTGHTEHTYKDWFDCFWILYPKRNGKKVGKVETKKKFLTIKPESMGDFITATFHYSKSSRAKEGYAKDPERFIGKDFWKDWLEPEVITPKGKQPENFDDKDYAKGGF